MRYFCRIGKRKWAFWWNIVEPCKIRNIVHMGMRFYVITHNHTKHTYVYIIHNNVSPNLSKIDSETIFHPKYVFEKCEFQLFNNCWSPKPYNIWVCMCIHWACWIIILIIFEIGINIIKIGIQNYDIQHNRRSDFMFRKICFSNIFQDITKHGALLRDRIKTNWRGDRLFLFAIDIGTRCFFCNYGCWCQI